MRWPQTLLASSFGVLVLPFVLALVAGCGRTGAAPADAGRSASSPVRARPVVVASPVASPWPRLVVLPGQLEAREQVEIAARVEGPVDYVGVDLGDEVRRGATLARISATDFRARTSQAEAQLAQARSTLARIESLDRPEAVSAQAREEAQTAVAVANAALDLARRQLVDANVRAPFAGVIAKRDVSRGAFVRIGTPLFTIVSTGTLRLALSVPERFVRLVTTESVITVLPEDVTSGEPGLEARVVRISPVIEQGTRTFRIEAEVEPHDGMFRPGMFVLGTLALGLEPNAVKLPRGAVFSMLGHDRVALVVDGRVELKDVELLGERDGFAVVAGLTASDVVVARGGGSLAPGTPVRIETGNAAPAATTPASTAPGASR